MDPQRRLSENLKSGPLHSIPASGPSMYSNVSLRRGVYREAGMNRALLRGNLSFLRRCIHHGKFGEENCLEM